MTIRAALTAILTLVATVSAAPIANLVSNGSFEEALTDWAAYGAPELKQQLALAEGRDGGRAARLECTVYRGDGPAAHAMMAQVGRVAVQRGHWYHLAFWARAEQITAGAVDVALSNTRTWEPTGLSETFTPGRQWTRFEFLFRAGRDVPAANSRLQFWFKSTGTLWLDDVELNESAEGQQWLPAIATEGRKNFVPNGSFECGAANWGSYSLKVPGGWMGNLFRLEGELDGTNPEHGGHSLKISLSPQAQPLFWFDYYEPIRQPVRCVLAANQGWFHVTPGEKLTLSAYLRADGDDVPAQLAAVAPGGAAQHRRVKVGREWQRHTYTFTASEPYLFIAAGLDLEGDSRPGATLWLDAVQLERGEHATDYEPRAPVEAFVETPQPGNIFPHPDAGAELAIHAFNNGDAPATAKGTIEITDFFDRPVWHAAVAIDLASHAAKTATYAKLAAGRRGYFRANWTGVDQAQTLRMAIIDPIPAGTRDSPLGFNHAYPWSYLVQSARAAGIVWWRDWSAQWQTIEREPGRFTWAEPDAQIGRVLEADGQVDVLIPFPAANWSSSAPDDVRRKAASGKYPDSRMPVAYAPRQYDAFGDFAANVVRHYDGDRRHPVRTFQILNESVYTSYALPQKAGYKVENYIQLLGAAYRAMKAADPGCVVVGGCGNPPYGAATREFLEQGGTRYCDIFDVHLYGPPVAAESQEETYRRMEELMRAHGGVKPIWMTEWGCYADDDPPCLPYVVGDASMNRSKWPNERAATEHIVKFVAVTFAHGMRKIFFHAGTCGAINGPDAGGVLFEYGGAPRKMYAGVAALTRLLGAPEACVGRGDRNGVRAYAFASRDATVAIAWTDPGQVRALHLGSSARAYDVMGNELSAENAALGESPVYVVAPRAAGEHLVDTLLETTETTDAESRRP